MSAPRVLHLRATMGLYGAERAILVLSAQHPDTMVIGLLDDARSDHTELYDEALAQGLMALRIPCAGAVDPLLAGRILRVIREHGIDVVHSHGYKPTLYGLPAARLARRGFVVTLHGKTGSTGSVKVYEKLEMRLLARADAVACVSPVLAQEASRLAPKVPVSYVPNGIDVDRTRLLSDLPRPIPEPYFVMVGRLSPEKGFDVLLEAVSLARVRLLATGTRIICIGDGPLKDSLLGQIRDRGLGDLIELRGFHPQPAMWMRHARAVLMPSHTEGLPYTALECMALGRTLVASRVGALPELLEEGSSGILVPPGTPQALADAMTSLIDDPGLGDRIGAAALATVRAEWSAEAMARRYEAEIYSHVRRRS